MAYLYASCGTEAGERTFRYFPAAERVGASLIEPAVYEVVVDARLLKDVKGVENQLAPQA